MVASLCSVTERINGAAKPCKGCDGGGNAYLRYATVLRAYFGQIIVALSAAPA